MMGWDRVVTWVLEGSRLATSAPFVESLLHAGPRAAAECTARLNLTTALPRMHCYPVLQMRKLRPRKLPQPASEWS